MKKQILFLLLIALIGNVWGQNAREKGLAAIDSIKARAIVEFLADDLLEGREAGRRGGQIAAAYLIAGLKQIGISAFKKDYIQPFKAYRLAGTPKARWKMYTEAEKKACRLSYDSLNMKNVLGFIPGKRSDEYVIVAAHYDHLGIKTGQCGDSIYNGADDNASGVSAVLQIAAAFIASGQQPERTVIFAFWDGEEIGLLGSRYFLENCHFRAEIKGYLNFDMIGRNHNEDNPQHVIYFYSDTKPVFGEWLKRDIVHYHLSLKPDYRPSPASMGGSDNAAFSHYHIPIIWYHTDGHPDYHKPTDHANRLNWNKLTDITRAAYLNAWNLANEAY